MKRSVASLEYVKDGSTVHALRVVKSKAEITAMRKEYERFGDVIRIWLCNAVSKKYTAFFTKKGVSSKGVTRAVGDIERSMLSHVSKPAKQPEKAAPPIPVKLYNAPFSIRQSAEYAGGQNDYGRV